MRCRVLPIVNFAALGLVTFTTNAGLSAALVELLRVPPELAVAISLCVVFCMSFLACRYMIFEKASLGGLKRQLTLFALSSLGFRGSEYVLFLLAYSILGFHYFISLVTVLVLSFVAKFVFYNQYIFVARQKL